MSGVDKTSPVISQGGATPLPTLTEEDVDFRVDDKDSYILLAQATIRHKHSVDEDLLIDAGRAVEKGAIHGAKAVKKKAKAIGNWLKKKKRENDLAERKEKAEEEREARKAEKEARQIEAQQEREEREAARAEQRRNLEEQRRLEEEQKQTELEQAAQQKQAEDKDTACALYNAAEDFLRDEEYREAAEQLRKMNRVQQAGLNSCYSFKDLLSTVAETATGLGNKKGAAAAYKKYLEWDPNDREIRAKLAVTYFQMGQLKRAEREAERVLEEDMPNAEAEVVLGIIHNNLEQLESVVGAEIPPDLQQKARDLLTTGHFRLAEMALTPEEREKQRVEGRRWLIATFYGTSETAPLLKLAERCEQWGEHTVAAEAYRKASCLQPEDEDQPDNHQLMAKAAEAYFKTGDFTKSVAWYEQAFALDKTNKQYEQQLVLARQQRDQKIPGGQGEKKQTPTDKEGDNPFQLCGAVFNFENGHYYRHFDDSIQTFEDARSKCSQWGGHLVTIHDKDESYFVSFVANGYDRYSRGEPMLLGLVYYVSDDKEGTWLWEGGEALTYTAWGRDEPNNAATKRYGVMVPQYRFERSRGQWKNIALPFSPSESAPFLSYMCERE